jgi:mRNA interferase MazF
LHIEAGDFIAWELAADGSARVRKAHALDREYLRSLEGTLTACLEAAGLPAPSVVRFKLFTLDHRRVRGRLGALSLRDVVTVRQAMATLFRVD